MARGKKTVQKEVKQVISPEQLTNEIRSVAHEIYLKRMKENKPGNDLSDWLEAEKIVKSKYGIK
jgi:hypothetical protein